MGQEQGKPGGDGRHNNGTKPPPVSNSGDDGTEPVEEEDEPSMFADLSVASKSTSPRSSMQIPAQTSSSTSTAEETQTQDGEEGSAFSFIAGGEDDEIKQNESNSADGDSSAFGFIAGDDNDKSSDSAQSSSDGKTAPHTQAERLPEPQQLQDSTESSTSSSAPGTPSTPGAGQQRRKKITIAKRPGYAASSEDPESSSSPSTSSAPSSAPTTPAKAAPTAAVDGATTKTPVQPTKLSSDSVTSPSNKSPSSPAPPVQTVYAPSNDASKTSVSNKATKPPTEGKKTVEEPQSAVAQPPQHSSPTPVAPASVEAPKTTDKKAQAASIEGQMKIIDLEMEEIRAKMKQLSEQQAAVYRELRSLHLATADLISQQRELERQQQRASEEEQFEKAEELSERLVKGNQDLAKHNTRVLALQEKLKQIQQSRLTVLQSEIDLRNGTLVSQLKALEEKQSGVVVGLKKSIASQRAQNDEALSARSEDIAKERSHVELDLKLVVERESKIQAAIDDQTVQLRESKVQLKSKLDVVQREIADLLEKLRLKRLEESEFLQDIGVIDDQIDTVTAKFTKELQRVTENKERTQERVAKLDAESRALEDERLKFESSIAALVQNQQKEETLLTKIRGDLSASPAAVAKAEKARQATETELIALEEDLVSAQTWIASLEFKRQSIATLEEDIRNLSERNLQTAKSIQAAKQRALVLKTDILPELEASKKAAAAARNFKEAAVLQKDIKDNQAEVEELEKKIESLQSQSSQDSQLLQKMTDELGTHSVALRELEKTHDADRLEVLQKEILSARVELRRATRLEDYDAAYLATAELEALRAEVRQIQERNQLDSVPELELPAEVFEEPVVESPIETPSLEVETPNEKNSNPSEPADVVASEESASESLAVAVDHPEEVQDSKEGAGVEGDDSPAFSFLENDGSEEPTAAEKLQQTPEQPVSVADDISSATNGDNEEGSSMFSGLSTDDDATAPVMEEDAPPAFPGISDDLTETTSSPTTDESSIPVDPNAARRVELQALIAELNEKKAGLDALLEQKCSEEDYEAADEINTQLEALGSSLTAAQSELDSL